MKILKTILTVALVAIVALGVVIALFWEQLLSPEQKVSYGFVFSAAKDYSARARANPDNEQIIEDYLDILVLTGNLGRATYLAELYGVENSDIGKIRAAIDKSIKSAQSSEVYALTKDPAFDKFDDTPLMEALRYAEGYRHALLGDWSSARNFFNAIDEKKLSPALRPYHQYYKARAYRLSGDDQEKAQVESLLLKVIEGPGDPDLSAKARYNLIAWYLSEENPNANGLSMAQGQQLMIATHPNSWAEQKGYLEMATYFWQREDIEAAWPMAVQSLMVNPEEQAGKSAAELILDMLEWIYDQHAGMPLEEGTEWHLGVEQPPYMYIALAKAANRFGLCERTAAVLGKYKGHVIERSSWEEIQIALAVCYRVERNGSAMKDLMSDANLKGFGDEALGRIYYEYALLLEAQGSWNKAIDYYRSTGKLGGLNAGNANFRCYAILKHVQEPLDIDRAVSYLSTVTQKYPDCEMFPKAVEELLPLYIYRGEKDKARNLISYVINIDTSRVAGNPDQLKTFEQLKELAYYWRAYLADEDGNSGSAAESRDQIRLKYWNYYELTSNYPPVMDFSTSPAVLSMEEHAGEYLAGLGLSDTSKPIFESNRQPGHPVFIYLFLRNMEAYKPLSSIQWWATEVLEQGNITEQPLLDYTLNLAYPHPYDPEVEAASREFGIDKALIYAIIKKESNFKEKSVSSVGAEGLMQLMPPTVRWLNDRYSLGVNFDRRLDPKVNIRLGTANLKSMFDQLNNKTRAVIHAYNGGAGNYKKWSGLYPGADYMLLTELIPNEENEGFGKKVTKYYKVYSLVLAEQSHD